MQSIKTICGIDTLYYYCQSNDNYKYLYMQIQDNLENGKFYFESNNIPFTNSDINIHINDIALNYIGNAEGFYMFKDCNGFFRIGFKDSTKNKNVHDIKVQLEATGIYTVGITSLIDFINNTLLDKYTTSNYQVTRADLNCFVQYDFSFISKDMFVSRKKKYTTISEIGNANSTQTLYIGKNPFKLRIYNKKEELKKSSKAQLMNEYFTLKGFNLENPIFNIEFELRREYLKEFKIFTIDELFANAVNLFQHSMDTIRLVDISNITQNDIKNNTKSRAQMLPIWQYIKESYNIDEFLQSALPLDRIKRKISIYDDYKFEKEYIALFRKAFINNLILDDELLNTLYIKAKESLSPNTNQIKLKQSYIDVDVYTTDNKLETYRLIDNELIKPINVVTVSSLSDYDLSIYLEQTQKDKDKSEHHRHIYEVALKEINKRGIV